MFVGTLGGTSWLVLDKGSVEKRNSWDVVCINSKHGNTKPKQRRWRPIFRLMAAGYCLFCRDGVHVDFFFRDSMDMNSCVISFHVKLLAP